MTSLVPAEDIERIVGAKRHPTLHLARAVSAEQTVYILHSQECLEFLRGGDLRDCPYSRALDNGIQIEEWQEDVPVAATIDAGFVARLVPDA